MKISEFNKNVFTLVTGTSIAQAIPILITPILTRLYTPEDFGIFALFASFCAILEPISNGRYELAIMLPEEEEESKHVFILCLMITAALSLVLLLIVLSPLSTLITDSLGEGKLTRWFPYIPIAVFFGGIYLSLRYYNLKLKAYKTLAQSTVARSSVRSASHLGFGMLFSGATGLIIGKLLEGISGIYLLWKNSTYLRTTIRQYSLSKVWEYAKRYQNFPKFSVPAAISNALSFELNKILISLFFSTSILGLYDMVDRILGAPSSFIGSSIGQVFYQEAVEEKNKTGKASNTFRSTVKKLFIIGVPIYCLIFIGVYFFFTFIFGEDWSEAGQYALIILPFLFARFILAPLSNLNNVFETQKFGFIWQFSKMVIAVGSILYAHFSGFSFEQFLYLMTYSLILHHIIIFFIFKRIANGQISRYFQ